MITELVILGLVLLTTTLIIFWLYKKTKYKIIGKWFSDLCDDCPDDYKKTKCIPYERCLDCGRCLTDNFNKCCANCNSLQSIVDEPQSIEHCHHHKHHNHSHSKPHYHSKDIGIYLPLIFVPAILGALFYKLWTIIKNQK